jgi:hypothetical protein
MYIHQHESVVVSLQPCAAALWLWLQLDWPSEVVEILSPPLFGHLLFSVVLNRKIAKNRKSEKIGNPQSQTDWMTACSDHISSLQEIGYICTHCLHDVTPPQIAGQTLFLECQESQQVTAYSNRTPTQDCIDIGTTYAWPIMKLETTTSDQYSGYNTCYVGVCIHTILVFGCFWTKNPSILYYIEADLSPM